MRSLAGAEIRYRQGLKAINYLEICLTWSDNARCYLGTPRALRFYSDSLIKILTRISV
jgi:hypothetical protein